jgi:hypothetical protein
LGEETLWMGERALAISGVRVSEGGRRLARRQPAPEHYKEEQVMS